METITSRGNPLCAHFRKLASSAAYRRETGEFLCDSPKLLGEAVRWGAGLTAVLFSGGAEPPPLPGVRTARVSESVMRAVSPMETPQGIVFSCRMADLAPPERLPPGRYVLLEGVQDPGNVGAVLRTADAFGWTVLLLPGCAGLYNPKTVRAAMGVHFRAAVYQCGLERAAALVREAGLPLYAAALGPRGADVRDLDLSRCAVVIGSEGRGVSPEALALCGGTLRIPMAERCESLNAAAAAAVVLWEGARPRPEEAGRPGAHDPCGGRGTGLC